MGKAKKLKELRKLYRQESINESIHIDDLGCFKFEAKGSKVDGNISFSLTDESLYKHGYVPDLYPAEARQIYKFLSEPTVADNSEFLIKGFLTRRADGSGTMDDVYTLTRPL